MGVITFLACVCNSCGLSTVSTVSVLLLDWPLQSVAAQSCYAASVFSQGGQASPRDALGCVQE